jgi:hypothetical protein
MRTGTSHNLGNMCAFVIRRDECKKAVGIHIILGFTSYCALKAVY